MSSLFARPAVIAGSFFLSIAITTLSSTASAKALAGDDDDVAGSDVPDMHVRAVAASSDSAAPSPSFDERWNASELADAPPAVDAPAVPRPASLDSKRFVVARDFGFAVPVGDLADRSGAMYGPLVRLGFHVNESLELGLRAGYQRGFDKEVDGNVQSLSAVPINASIRYFILGHRSGPYAGLEAGVNVFRQRVTARTSIWDVGADATWVRPDANLGVGYVVSKTLPIDVRAQVASLDLISGGKGPTNALTVGISAGYSIFF
jgi:hypothetical protein